MQQPSPCTSLTLFLLHILSHYSSCISFYLPHLFVFFPTTASIKLQLLLFPSLLNLLALFCSSRSLSYSLSHSISLSLFLPPARFHETLETHSLQGQRRTPQTVALMHSVVFMRQCLRIHLAQIKKGNACYFYFELHLPFGHICRHNE